jgi:hypothetical protein
MLVSDLSEKDWFLRLVSKESKMTVRLRDVFWDAGYRYWWGRCQLASHQFHTGIHGNHKPAAPTGISPAHQSDTDQMPGMLVGDRGMWVGDRGMPVGDLGMPVGDRGMRVGCRWETEG